MPRQEGAFICPTGLINTGCSSLAVGEVGEQGDVVACAPPPPEEGLKPKAGDPMVKTGRGTANASGTPVGSHARCSAGSLRSAGNRQGSTPLGAFSIARCPPSP